MLHDALHTLTAHPSGDSRLADESVLESHALLEAIASRAPAGLGMLDRNLRFVRVNPKLAELNGLPAEAHIGRTPRELFPALPLDEMEAQWRRILDTGEPVLGFEFCGETPAAPGRTRWWREDWYPVSSLGHVIGIGVIVVEVTEEKRAAELQRLLVGIVGHDLRNPLSVITTSAQVLLAREHDDGRAKSLRRIERAARRIEALARDLLDYTRVTGGGAIPVDPRSDDLSQILEAAAEETRVAHPYATIECEGQPVRGNWDRDRILQLLEERLIPGLRERITTLFHYTPRDFAQDLGAHLGSAFSLEPLLTQSAWFRVHNRDDKIPNLYFVGAGTHPGAGIPGVVGSAKATAGLMIDDLRG